MKHNESERPDLPLPLPTRGATTADVRADFAKISKQTPRNVKAEQAFLASKLQLLHTHPALQMEERTTLAHDLMDMLKNALPDKEPPSEGGGVGYGIFYKPSFKTAFVTGTAICWEIICPNPPSGNVDTWLYLTATNRAAKGVEAFISYCGQNETLFKIYDWARTDQRWQTNVPFVMLSPYLKTTEVNSVPCQVSSFSENPHSVPKEFPS